MNEMTDQLRKLIYAGASKKRVPITDLYLDRISDELRMLEEKKRIKGLLLQAQLIEVCNDLNILRSIGNSNASNSLVNYCLDITKIDPIEADLVFESYCLSQKSATPHIVIEIPTGMQTKIRKEFVRRYPHYKSFAIAYSASKEKDEMDLLYQNMSLKKHPSGIVFTTDDVKAQTFKQDNEIYYLCQNTKNDIYFEHKVDLVETEFLNQLQQIVDTVDEAFQPHQLPLDDSATFNLIRKGDTDFIFPFADQRMKELLKEFEPQNLQDLSILYAMTQPRAIRHFSVLVENKHKDQQAYFEDNTLNDILQETYGCLAYEETVIRIMIELAGMDYSTATTWFKKLVDRRGLETAVAFGEAFEKGCIENSNLNQNDIRSITELIWAQADDVMPKAVALNYATLGYYLAYYKTHFNAQFQKAVTKNLSNFTYPFLID